MPAKPPIFILGVPRSGTTLLRAILDSHSAIACGPETPWLGGHQPRSLMSLWSALRDEPWGYCRSYRMPWDIPTAAARGFLSTLMDEYARARGKRRWAEKTPDNALFVDFLAELYPEARFVHLVRNGLDVAMSTSVVAPHRRGMDPFLEQNVGFGPGAPAAPNSPLAAILRWRHWNNLIEGSLARRGLTAHRLSYERLVTEPEATVRELMAFLDEPYEPSMLEYARSKHEFPEWEWGSADVKARGGITAAAVGRARRELGTELFELLAPVAEPGGAAVQAGVLDASARVERGDAEFAGLLKAFGTGLGLDGGAQSAGWVWRNAIAPVDWRGKHVLFDGPSDHVVPWIVAMLGARVTMLEFPASRSSLAQVLRVDLGGPSGESEAEWLMTTKAFDQGLLAGLKNDGYVVAMGDAAASWCSARGVKHEGRAAAAILVRAG